MYIKQDLVSLCDYFEIVFYNTLYLSIERRPLYSKRSIRIAGIEVQCFCIKVTFQLQTMILDLLAEIMPDNFTYVTPNNRTRTSNKVLVSVYLIIQCQQMDIRTVVDVHGCTQQWCRSIKSFSNVDNVTIRARREIRSRCHKLISADNYGGKDMDDTESRLLLLNKLDRLLQSDPFRGNVTSKRTGKFVEG